MSESDDQTPRKRTPGKSGGGGGGRSRRAASARASTAIHYSQMVGAHIFWNVASAYALLIISAYVLLILQSTLAL